MLSFLFSINNYNAKIKNMCYRIWPRGYKTFYSILDLSEPVKKPNFLIFLSRLPQARRDIEIRFSVAPASGMA